MSEERVSVERRPGGRVQSQRQEEGDAFPKDLRRGEVKTSVRQQKRVQSGGRARAPAQETQEGAAAGGAASGARQELAAADSALAPGQCKPAGANVRTPFASFSCGSRTLFILLPTQCLFLKEIIALFLWG